MCYLHTNIRRRISTSAVWTWNCIIQEPFTMIYSQYDWSSSLALFGCVCEKKDEGKVERRCKCSAGEGERKQMWIPLIDKLRGAANKCCYWDLELWCWTFDLKKPDWCHSWALLSAGELVKRKENKEKGKQHAFPQRRTCVLLWYWRNNTRRSNTKIPGAERTAAGVTCSLFHRWCREQTWNMGSSGILNSESSAEFSVPQPKKPGCWSRECRNARNSIAGWSSSVYCY